MRRRRSRSIFNICENTTPTTIGRANLFFFFNDTATTEIYTLSLHDALPICAPRRAARVPPDRRPLHPAQLRRGVDRDRKSTRLNSSHANISYAVFCLKKKKDADIYRYSSEPTTSPHRHLSERNN